MSARSPQIAGFLVLAIAAIALPALSLQSSRAAASATGRVDVHKGRGQADTWRRLRRPLRIPTIAHGGRCPRTSANPNRNLAKIEPGLTGVAWGRGPAYPGGLGTGSGPVLRYLDPIPVGSLFHGSKWFGNKVMWVIDRAYRGPLLIRGRQLDGAYELRFDRGRLPPREMRFESSAPPRGRPSFTRVRGPGCYAYQVDGISFSYLIVFEAKPY